MSKLQYEIAWNNAGVNDVCGACGARINPFIGYEPFLAGSKTIICDDCASAGELVSEVPEGFVLFDQATAAADIEQLERDEASASGCGFDTPAATPPQSAPDDDPVPF